MPALPSRTEDHSGGWPHILLVPHLSTSSSGSAVGPVTSSRGCPNSIEGAQVTRHTITSDINFEVNPAVALYASTLRLECTGQKSLPPRLVTPFAAALRRNSSASAISM